jgi:hypothetical protein
MDRGKWEIRGEVRKWTDVPLHGESLDFRYGPWGWYRGVGDTHMNRGD